MKMLWKALLGFVVLLVSCEPPQISLESLLPSNAIAVAYVRDPFLLKTVLDAPGSLWPWSSVDTSRPWGAAIVPGRPPGFVLAVALSSSPSAWSTIQDWARERGGLQVVAVGNYAVMSSPGVVWKGRTAPIIGSPFSHLKKLNQPLSAAFDISKMGEPSDWPKAFKSIGGLVGWLKNNVSLAVVSLGTTSKGITLHLELTGTQQAPWWSSMKSWSARINSAKGTADFDPQSSTSVSLAVSSEFWRWLSSLLPDPVLSARAGDLIPLLGSRLLIQGNGDLNHGGSWALRLESTDALGLRQALRTLVASGDLQRLFPKLAWDPDTPIFYQDTVNREGSVRGILTVGRTQVLLDYGTHAVVAATGPLAASYVDHLEQVTDQKAVWPRPFAQPSIALGRVMWSGVPVTWSLSSSRSGNPVLEVQIEASSVTALKTEAPQKLLNWLTGEGDSK